MAASEAASLKAVSAIRYKIATVSSDEKSLSGVLSTQLVPLLEKAGSPYKAVRDAAFQAYISVSKFIQPPGVGLPVASLLQQYKTTASPVVKQLDLGLAKRGLQRLDQSERRQLLPIVLRNISKEANSSGAPGFFAIFLRLLLEIEIPPRGSSADLSLRETVGLSNPSDSQYVSTWLGKLFLLRQDIALAEASSLDAVLAFSPSGLSKDEVEFLRNKDPKAWQPSAPGSLSLPECKLKAVSFLASAAFTDDERFLPAVCASGSADSRITAVADDVVKRSNVNLEDRDLARTLLEAHQILPAAHRIQILRILTKSVSACTLGTEVVEVVRGDFELTSGEIPAVSGLEALRLHKALLGFLSWVARNASDSAKKDSHMRPNLVILLKDYILRQGWPSPAPSANQSQYQDEQRLRANAYETIGTLASSSSLEHKVKDSLLKWLFDSLVSDPSPDVVVYIESALSSMMRLFDPKSEGEHRDLEILLLDYMTLSGGQGIRTARHIATRFANNCLPYSNIKARWIDILALSGGPSERRDVLEEGTKGLDPWWASKLHPDEGLVLPDWAKMAHTFFDVAPRQLGDDEMALDQKSSYTPFSNDHLQAFPVALRYIRHILFLTAVKETKFEIDWETQLENRLSNDLNTRASVREYLAVTNPDALLKVLGAGLDGLRDHPEVGAEECVRGVADILSLSPVATVSAKLSNRANEILSLVRYRDQRVRQLASQAFAILATWSDESESLISQLRSHLDSVEEPSASQSAEYQGSLLFLGRYLSYSALYGKSSTQDATSHEEKLYTILGTALKTSDHDLQTAAIEVMSQLWTTNMAFPTGKADSKETIGSLEKLAKTDNEKAITALGRLAIPASAEMDVVDTILATLFALSETKRTEIHFAIGEAIAAAIARWDSEAVRLSLDVAPLDSSNTELGHLGQRPQHVERTLDKLITDCKGTKPSVLRSSGIWLFCIIQYCSHLEAIQSRLRECQAAFMRLLTAREELVQETASRGLALVYEKGDTSLKGDLVRDLVATFTGAKTQLKVDDDTELFDAGALPTGEGKSVTSYKDIISLANEVGDQSLIYKFMALATNAATWTARSAFGRFGLSNILSDAELDPKIYPKLFRYRFDPNANVRRSMDDIWKAVVKDATAVIDTHFDAIMKDLLKSILDGREWRAREASCAAIGDLIYGKPYSKYEKYYTDIWRVTLKVLDDQKGSVREAALKLCMGLSRTLVTQLQENNSSTSAKAMISQVLPFLLSDKGIDNSAKEVKIMAITSVLDIVKNGGEALRPFITTIVIHFLGLLGTIEPEAINYYYQRVKEEDREELDKLRSSAATRSPLFECIANCLRFVDEDVMKEFAPQFAQTIKSAIGMQTKVGCSEVLATLSMRHSLLLAPYNAMFLKVMQTQILDRNHEVNKAYARASAYLLRTATEQARESFTTRLSELYFAAEDESRRQKIADAVLAIAKVSPDAFTDLESRLLPFAYLGKHDTDSYVSEEFEAVWSQHAGGNHTVLRFVDEITDLAAKALATSKWALQHGAALTMASMITALGNVAGKDGLFKDSDVQKTWPVLDKSLSLKTFKGKEKLIATFPIFIHHSKNFWTADEAVAAQSKKIAVREAKRNNEEYRPHALEALADFAAEREDLDMYAEVVGIVSEYLTPEDDADHGLTDMQRKTVAAALKAVMTAYNRPKMQLDSGSVLTEIISTVETAKRATILARHTWFTCAADIMKAAVASGTGTDTSKTASRWFSLLAGEAVDDTSLVESQRLSRAKALDAFVVAWQKGVFGSPSGQDALREEIRQKLSDMVAVERSIDVQKVLQRALAKFS